MKWPLISLALSFISETYYHLLYLVSFFLTSAVIFGNKSSFILMAYWIKEVRSRFQEDEVKATYVLEEECHQKITRQNNARSTADKKFLRSRFTIELDYRFTMLQSFKDVIVNKKVIAVRPKHKKGSKISCPWVQKSDKIK